MKKKAWHDNKKDMATKQLFNQIWFGIFISALIIGSKHIAYFNSWEGYVVALFSVLMLYLQQVWEWDMINTYRERSKKK